ncbi:hypothetical protein [Pedobacter agri]|uniref:hypothetical protein n=1 Tax=Pedobacter agri TaxID=454586 RepID=UPI00277ED09D|nr:hypothetical protein [Pedobacter agri]MDQ1140107.1 hypothetical protein [Pedobacter agri]
MENPRGLLYSSFHKLYNAMSSLEKFEKGNNFFDNIAHLDNFFSEFRNITFVLQKALANTDFFYLYEELRNKYLINDIGRWFVKKRNEVTKQQPFDLEKRISIRLYSATNTVALPELTFTIDNDVEYSTIIESLKKTFLELNAFEVMFSTEFTFHEKGKTEDLYGNFIFGINSIKMLLTELKITIAENSPLCDELEKKIESFNFYKVPKNFLLIDDYIFYCQKDRFEKASRVEFFTDRFDEKISVSKLNDHYKSAGRDIFDGFVTWHLVIFQMQKLLMPTCIIFYNDDTFRMKSFDGSIKTTIYRKMNEIANTIEKDGINKIFFVNEMYTYPSNYILTMDSIDRIKHADGAVLCFYMIDKDLSSYFYSFDTNRLEEGKYLASVFTTRSEMPNKNYGILNSIMKEFEKLKQKSL